MPIRYDKDKKRFRFEFKRVIAGRLIRASKLLPAGWSQAQADAYDRQESGSLYAVASGIEKPKPLIAEAVKPYLDHKIPKLKNGKKAAQDLAHLIPYIEGKTLDQLGEISRQYISDHKHLAAATVHNRLAYLKSSCRYSYKHHNIGDRDYTDRMVLPSVNNRRQVYISQDDLHDRLLPHITDESAHALFTLVFYTGLRWRSEVLTLKPHNIVDSDGQKWISIADSKNGTPHMIPVHQNALQALQCIPFPWSDSYYYARFWKARDAAGLKHFRIHDERHSFASALLAGGASLSEIGAALNHKSVQSTNRYAHMTPAGLLKTVNGLPIKLKVK